MTGGGRAREGRNKAGGEIEITPLAFPPHLPLPSISARWLPGGVTGDLSRDGFDAEIHITLRGSTILGYGLAGPEHIMHNR